MSSQAKETPKRYTKGTHYHDLFPGMCGCTAEGKFTAAFTAKNAFATQSPVPMMESWVEAKKKSPHALVFMKVGRFYEVFHSDADVIVSEMDSVYMLGIRAHTGFPETSLRRFVTDLSAKGYEVVLLGV